MKTTLIDRVFSELVQIRYRLDEIERTLNNRDVKLPITLESAPILELPDHLRRTFLTVLAKSECTTVEVSNLTGRGRATESLYLNELVRGDWLTKRRQGKTYYFSVKEGKITPVDKIYEQPSLAELRQYSN